MPHMFPEVLRRDLVNSAAEYELYDLFRQQLADDFYVFHSVAWLGRRRGRTTADGEADFVIIHPRIGILILEVKGGIVGHDAATGWYSIQRGSKQHHAIKNPFGQARDSKYHMISKIRDLPNWPGRIPTIGHAVAFPDGTVDNMPDLGPDAPREIILLHTDKQNLDAWMRNCMGHWGADGFVPPGDNGVRILQEVLARSWLLRPPKLGEAFNIERQAIDHYTDDQFRVLQMLAGRPRAAIRGCAGSGKTMIAVHKARQLAREGFRVLLTCYNRNLAGELRHLAGEQAYLKVRGFHALCREYAALTGFDQRPEWDDARPDFFDSVMPEALLEAAAASDEYRFDAIVVDEGQDFQSTWWDALEMLLQDPERGVFYVFFDDNQLVYPHDLTLPVSEMPFSLTENCRNTRHIQEAILAYYQSDTPFTVRGPEGRPVESVLWNPSELKTLQQGLAEILGRLVFAEGVDSQDIVILSAGGLKKPPLSDLPPPLPFRLVPHPSPVREEIYATTIRLFKGLERPVVILIVPRSDAAMTELMYVGQSRARHHLILLTLET